MAILKIISLTIQCSWVEKRLCDSRIICQTHTMNIIWTEADMSFMPCNIYLIQNESLIFWKWMFQRDTVCPEGCWVVCVSHWAMNVPHNFTKQHILRQNAPTNDRASVKHKYTYNLLIHLTVYKSAAKFSSCSVHTQFNYVEVASYLNWVYIIYVI